MSGNQNPRINVQSILLRHALIHRLFGDRFDDVMEAELRLAVELNEAIRTRAIELGVTMKSYLNPKRAAAVRQVDEVLGGRDTQFAARWADLLGGEQAKPIKVLEFACGSANDYRAFVEYGLAPFLDYSGVDLTEKNILNARSRFPGVTFQVGSILDLPFSDGAFDVVIASDIFEHLPIDDMVRALGQAERLAGHAVVLTFFSMADIPDHVVSPTGVYHWNRLSRSKVEALLDQRFESVVVTHINALLVERYAYPHSFNDNAWTIVASRTAR